jgi:phosphoribosylglycinamide formyltransferase-1
LTPRSRIAVLISGEGTNLQALIDAARRGALNADIALVASNRLAARGLERASAAGIPARHVAASGLAPDVYDAALTAAVAAAQPDLVVLAGFMRILGPRFLERFAGRTINIHPSLLPKYPGLDTHVRVLAGGDSAHGATVHFVTAELDAGPPIIQYRLPVRPGDTAATLQARVHRGEHVILPRAAEWFTAGRLSLGPEGAMLDGALLSEPVIVEEAT